MTFLSQDNNPHSFKVKTDERDFLLEQNVASYKEYAKQQRDVDEIKGSNGRTHRSFAIIPDIVAIDILTKYGIDIHAPETMHDPVLMRRFKQIVETDYPLLKTSNIKAL